MVGVAGRSKACTSCRKQRRGCDLQRPECGQCLRAGRKCPGYTDGLTIIHAKNSSSYDGTHPGTIFSRERQTPKSVSQDVLSAKIETNTFNRSSFHFLVESFLSSYLPHTYYPNVSKAPWLVICASGSKAQKSLLNISLLALAASTIGHEQHKRELVAQGARSYGDGLKALQRTLRHAQLWRSDETLAACMALLLYEVVECPDSTRIGYLSHHEGMKQLVRLRGPTSYDEPLGHQVFCSFRLVEALYSLEKHSSTFLTGSAWLTTPWREFERVPYDHIIDILLQIPGLLEKANQILNQPKGDHALLNEALIDRYRELDLQLDSLERKALRTVKISEQLYWPVLSDLKSVADDDVFGKVLPVSYRFRNVDTALGMMLLWSTKAMVWAGLRGTYAYMDTLVQSQDQIALQCAERLSPLGEVTEWIVVARNALQCVEYCIEEPSSGHAKTAVIIPLQMLAGYLKTVPAYHREFHWVTGILDALSGSNLRIVKCALERFKFNG